MLRFLRHCCRGVGETAGDPSVSVLSGNELWEVADAVVAVTVLPAQSWRSAGRWARTGLVIPRRCMQCEQAT